MISRFSSDANSVITSPFISRSFVGSAVSNSVMYSEFFIFNFWYPSSRYNFKASLAYSPILAILSFEPLPNIFISSSFISFTFIFTSSLTRTPEPYRTSNISLSLWPSDVSKSGTSNSSSISL